MTKSVTLLFPGQGSQYVGMGKNLNQELYQQADLALDYKLSAIILDGPEEELKLTANTQPAILSHSITLFHKLQTLLNKTNTTIDYVLGHSVGEYAALVAAGSLRFEDAVKAVHLRGKYMQESVPVGVGKMIALMKISPDIIEQACNECSDDQFQVMPANFNEPNQTVISGHAQACDKLITWLEEKIETPYRAIELNVSAPFHSSLMKPAAEKLKTYFDSIEFMNTKLPYIANVDAKEYAVGTNANVISDNLIKQVAGSVCWSQSIAKLPDDTICLEVGPGRVLMGLVRKINRNIKVIPLDKEGAFDELEELLS